MSKIPLSRPDINDDDIEHVMRALRSGQLSMGPYLDQFEKVASEYLGTRHAVAVSSGTAGLHLCMYLAGVEDGSEVITSPFSFVASANCVVYQRGTPVFVDIDERDFNINADAVEAAVTSKTAAILPIHVFGRPANLKSLCKISDKRGVFLVEDACEAIGAEVGGQKVGTFGQAAVFGFYPNKQMTTGEGGLIVTNDSEWAQKLRALRNQGRSSSEWLEYPDLGFNYRLDEMSAALGVSQMSRIESLLERRAAVAAKYTERLRRIPGISLPMPVPDSTRMSWFVYIIQFQSARWRNEVATRMNEKGIPTRNYFPPIHLQPLFVERYGCKRGQFPITERIADQTLAIPFHTTMTEEDIDRVCEALRVSIDEVA